MRCEKCESGKCCPISMKGVKFGLAFGITNAIFLLVLAWAGFFMGFGLPVIDQSANIYYGYAPTIMGGIWGAIGGFILGFIYGYIFGMVIKCFGKCCSCSQCGNSCK